MQVPKDLYKQAIRKKCVDCCCGNVNEANLCPAEDCPLWAFRNGLKSAEAFEEIRINSVGVQRHYPNFNLAKLQEASAKFRERINSDA